MRSLHIIQSLFHPVGICHVDILHVVVGNLRGFRRFQHLRPRRVDERQRAVGRDARHRVAGGDYLRDASLCRGGKRKPAGLAIPDGIDAPVLHPEPYCLPFVDKDGGKCPRGAPFLEHGMGVIHEPARSGVVDAPFPVGLDPKPPLAVFLQILDIIVEDALVGKGFSPEIHKRKTVVAKQAGGCAYPYESFAVFHHLVDHRVGKSGRHVEMPHPERS